MAMGFGFNITANASEALEALGRVRDKATDLERGIAKVQKNLNSFGTTATKGLTVPIVATTTAMALATREAMKFNKSMSEVSTLLQNVSRKDFEMIKKQTLDFSSKMGIASEKVIPALYQAISAGIPKENVFTFLETAGRASIAGVTSLETAVDGLTSVVNAYGSDILDVEKASDLMFTTVRLGKTNFEELSKSLYNVIPTASSLGVSFEDVSAALATITIQGTPTSVATTQLRQALVELSKEGSKTDLIFRELAGKSFRDFISSGGDLQSALKLLESNANKTGKSISDSFSSVEAGNAVLQLTGKSADTFSSSLNEMNNSLDATSVAFSKMEGDESYQFEKIKVEVQNLIIELGQKLIPVVRDDLLPLFKDTLIPTAQKLAEKIGELFTLFNNLSPELKNASFQFMGLVAVIGPAALALSTMVGGVTSARTAIVGMQTIFKTLIPIITTKTAAVKASAVAWKLLNATMLLSPVGIIATLTTLFAGLTVAAYKKEKADKAAYEAAIKHSEALQKSATESLKLTTQTNNLLSSYSKLETQTRLTKEEQEEQRQIVEKLEALYPDLDIAYDNNGKVIGSLTDMVYGLNEARRLEEIQAIASQKATLDAEISKRQKEIDSMDARLKDKNSAENTGITGGITLNHNKNLVQKELEALQTELDALDKLKEKLDNASVNTGGSRQNNNNNNRNKPSSSGVSSSPPKSPEPAPIPDKVFADYLSNLEKELILHDARAERLKVINENYGDTQALQERNAIITSAITEMATELELTENQALKLGDTYGSAFDSTEMVADFGTMKNAIYENIKAYEEEVKVRRELGEVIDESDVNTQKAELTKQGILNIVSVLKLTEKQVEELKDEFGDLFKSVESDSETLTGYLDENWQSVLNSLLDFSSELMGNVNALIQSSTQAQIDELERRKENSINAINAELDEYLKANKIMEKTEKDRLKDSIKEMQKRQKIALGLYEQERLKKAIEEEQANLKRITAEEAAQLKIQELEKKYANEKMRLEHKQAMASWGIQLAQATVSGAQAIVNAVNAGMSAGPGALVMVPLLTGMAAVLTATQIAAIAVAKPLEPQYLASGGLIRRRSGGLNAIIGEGNSNEAVIPLKDDVLAGIGEAMAFATQNKQVVSNQSISNNDMEAEIEYRQPIMLNIDGKTVGGVILGLTKRGVKVVHQRGIIQ